MGNETATLDTDLRRRNLGAGFGCLVGSSLMVFPGAHYASYYALETGHHGIFRWPLYVALALGVLGGWLLGNRLAIRAGIILAVLFSWGVMGDYFTSFSKYKVGPGPRWAKACFEDARALKCGRLSRGAIDQCLMERIKLEKRLDSLKNVSAACIEFMKRTSPYRNLRHGEEAYLSGDREVDL